MSTKTDETSSGREIRHAPSAPKKPYSPPRLTVFGQVAALTQSNGCSASTDGAGSCTPGAMGGSMASDRRAKENIVRIGEHPAGFGLYLFSYRAAHLAAAMPGRHFGVMADEVEPLFPGAVGVGPDGYKRVDYAALGIRLVEH